MKITFLGTGTSQGVPVIACDCDVCSSIDFHDKRLRSSIHLDIDGLSIVVDSGPDFRQQMLNERIKRLDALLFTHEHKDHTAGMDDIRSFNFKQREDIPIYAEPRVIEQLKREFQYIFQEAKYPGVPKVEIQEINNTPFQVKGEKVLPIRAMHYKLPVFGFRFRDFTYITDANLIEPGEKEKIKGSKVLVLNALQQKEHISHFTLEQALELVEELKPEKAYFTHISHKMGLHQEVGEMLPDNVKLAYDGLQIHL